MDGTIQQESGEGGTGMANRGEILEYCARRLDVGAYQDVAINGLQVEGTDAIDRIAVAVSTSDRTISEAIDWNADALLVHHGLFWGSKLQPLTGLLGKRLGKLFKHDINLIGYHLPLDGHAEIGNNAILTSELGLEFAGRFGDVAGVPLGVIGKAAEPLELPDILNRLEDMLDRTPVAVGTEAEGNRYDRIGILSGSGYGTIAELAASDCRVLITGDVREPTMAEARELGVVAIAAGHEATERTGIQALANELATEFSVETRFFSDPNPI
ncbi:MAG: Nif3-like dinuclear metal center hexameric protein [Thermomicrobiales bacterium]